MSATSRPFVALICLACAVHLALAVAAGPGFMSSDDEVYTRFAADMAHGRFELFPEHRANRLGLIAPTALAYSLLGIGRWTTVIWPMLCSLAGIVLVALVARRVAGDRAGAIAAFVFAPLTLVVNGSCFLMPDLPVGIQMFGSAACLWIARQSSGRRAASWGAASALLVAVGVMTKLTTLWMAPLFFAIFVVDVWRRRHGAAWIAFAATGAVTAVVFFGCYAIASGDPLYRLHAVDDKHNDTHWAFESAGVGALLRRVSYEPALMLVRSLPELTVLAALAIASAVGAAVRRPRPDAASTAPAARADVRFWIAYTIVVVAGFWIGTTSFERFAPLPLLPRMLAPSAAPLAVLAALALRAGRAPRIARATCTVVLVAAAGVAVADGRMLIAAMYTGAAFVAWIATGASGRASWAAAVGIILLPCAMCGYSLSRGGVGESPRMRAERGFVANMQRHTGESAVVVSDRRSERTVRYYRGYEPGTPRFVAWDDLTELPQRDGKAFVYWHTARVAWRGGRMAPPDWLPELLETGDVAWKSRWASLIELNR